MQDFDASLSGQLFHLRVPALDAVFEVDCEDADVDRLDDVLVKLFQALKLSNLLLQPAVELSILNCDADVAGERLQQLHIFAREEVSIIGATQPNHRDGARAAAITIGDAAGKIVVQIKPSGAAALRLREPENVLRVVQKDVVVRAG